MSAPKFMRGANPHEASGKSTLAIQIGSRTLCRLGAWPGNRPVRISRALSVILMARTRHPTASAALDMQPGGRSTGPLPSDANGLTKTWIPANLPRNSGQTHSLSSDPFDREHQNKEKKRDRRIPEWCLVGIVGHSGLCLEKRGELIGFGLAENFAASGAGESL